MKKRHGAEQVVVKLRQADVALGKGSTVPRVCKQLDVSGSGRTGSSMKTLVKRLAVGVPLAVMMARMRARM